MVALTARALIIVQEHSPDVRILPALEKMYDYLWQSTWNKQAEAFVYTLDEAGVESDKPAPDLNLLIAPGFAWLALETGNQRHIQRGDVVFSAGVRNAFLGQAKQFNQNYFWSFDYLTWRKAALSKAKKESESTPS